MATALGCVIALSGIILFVRLRWPSPLLLFIKLYTSALSPLLFACGVLVAMTGLITGSAFISLIGVGGALIYFIHVIRITRPPEKSNGFEQAFGFNWEGRIASQRLNYFLPLRALLTVPRAPDPIMHQNVCFSVIPGTDRKLLCDLWQPSANIPPSGLAFIYLHGSAWYLLDKDVGTRPFFRHLASQGHVVMDVAYRLAPETDMMGMVHDVRRAVIWMKRNAHLYGVNPDKIVLGGGSAGGHLALLTSYTAHDQRFSPIDLEDEDSTVCGVISEYGPTDLEVCYYHTNQHLTTRSIPGKPKKAVPTQMPQWIIKKMGQDYFRLGFNKGFENAGALAPLLGCHPGEQPEPYRFFSPVTHIHGDCPPTLIIQGEHDLITSERATRVLYARLKDKKVPVVMHILPQTDHAFDLIQPNLSPSAHNAWYDVERFLGILAGESKGKALVRVKEEVINGQVIEGLI